MAACVAALVLAACGGGGGGGGGGSTEVTRVGGKADDTGKPPTIGKPADIAPPAVAAAPVTLNGQFLYQAPPAREKGGLDYGAMVDKPVRFARVKAVDLHDRVLASATTDATGRYRMSVPPGTPLRVIAFAAVPNVGTDAASNLIEVVDNTSHDTIHAVSTTPMVLIGGDKPVLARIPAGGHAQGAAAGKAPGAADRLAGPFAILDTAYEARARVLAAAPDLVFAPLSIFWSTSNRASTVLDPAHGQIPGAAFYAIGGANLIFLNGEETLNTDEFDPSVITHEWGHYFLSSLSRSDSVGGPHRLGDLLDREVAFSEGFGDALAGILLDQDHYIDTYGPLQADSFAVDLKAGPSRDKGWFNEASVMQVIWKLHQAAGLRPIVDALTGPFRTTVASTGIHAFNAALAQVSASAAARLAPLLTAQGIDSQADAWGLGETNDGGLAIALPMVQAVTPGTTLQNVCITGQGDPAGHGNTLGRIAHLRFSVPADGRFQVRVEGPAGTDPDFRIHGRPGLDIPGFEPDGAIEDATVDLKAGDYLMAVSARTLVPGSNCFTVSVKNR